MSLAAVQSKVQLKDPTTDIYSELATTFNDDDLARLIQQRYQGTYTFRGWLPTSRQLIAIAKNIHTKHYLYLDLNGREYAFRPYAEFGGELILATQVARSPHRPR